MSNIAIVDLPPLEAIHSAVSQYIEGLLKCFQTASEEIGREESEWNDEEYYQLLSALKSFDPRVEEMRNSSAAVIKKAADMIEKIHELHGGL